MGSKIRSTILVGVTALALGAIPVLAVADDSAVSAEAACGSEANCQSAPLEPGPRTLWERVYENIQVAETEAERTEGESLLAAIEADALPSAGAINAARPVCYSALTGTNPHSLIMVPLPHHTSDLDAVCHVAINNGWHAGGIAKGNYFYQNCGQLENVSYGGGYTSYVPEDYFEANRSRYPSCSSNNAFVCCSPQFPN
jgi:hypothetical protein